MCVQRRQISLRVRAVLFESTFYSANAQADLNLLWAHMSDGLFVLTTLRYMMFIQRDDVASALMQQCLNVAYLLGIMSKRSLF